MRSFHRMPKRFTAKAPELVREKVLDIFKTTTAAPLDYDILLYPSGFGSEVIGLDFGIFGQTGQHFFLKEHEARAYRDRNRRRRVAWHDLPKLTQNAIRRYLMD